MIPIEEDDCDTATGFDRGISERAEVILEALDSLSGRTCRGALATKMYRESRDADACGDAPGIRDLEIRLHHVDLPQLDERGVVEYDWERNIVRASNPRVRGSAH